MCITALINHIFISFFAVQIYELSYMYMYRVYSIAVEVCQELEQTKLKHQFIQLLITCLTATRNHVKTIK